MYLHIKGGERKFFESNNQELYQYTVMTGNWTVTGDRRCSYWYLEEDEVVSKTGNSTTFDSKKLCVEIYGYTPEKRTSTFSRSTDLPYINGCSTKQLITPTRLGDPTWQMLYIPPHTSEQHHHIHSTARIVYVHSGHGISKIGQDGKYDILDLNPGDVLILNKMVPHHFETKNNPLTVLPLHIFSSTEHEFNHPMYNGTHRT